MCYLHFLSNDFLLKFWQNYYSILHLYIFFQKYCRWKLFLFDGSSALFKISLSSSLEYFNLISYSGFNPELVNCIEYIFDLWRFSC